MKRFLIGTLANTAVVLLGYFVLATTLSALVETLSGDIVNPLQTYMVASALIGTMGVLAAFLHVRLTSSSAIGPVLAVVGACAVTTLVTALASRPVLPALEDSILTALFVATAATGALLGGSLGILRRG